MYTHAARAVLTPRLRGQVALNRMALARGEARYNELAIQLAKAVHRHFEWSTPGGGLHMHWKMSIDLRRPAVMSEGNLDPFDCLATYKLLQEHAAHTPHALVNEIRGALHCCLQLWSVDSSLMFLRVQMWRAW